MIYLERINSHLHKIIDSTDIKKKTKHSYDYIGEYREIEPDHLSKIYVRFITTALDKMIGKTGAGWSNSKRLLLFEFQNRLDKLMIKLIIGSGDVDLRKKIFDIATNHPEVFKGQLNITPQFKKIYSKELMLKGF